MSAQTWQSAIQLLEQKEAPQAPNGHVAEVALALEVFCYSDEGRIARRLLEVSGQKIGLAQEVGPGYVTIYFLTSTGFESKTTPNLTMLHTEESDTEQKSALDIAVAIFQNNPMGDASVQAVLEYITIELDKIALGTVG